MKLYATVASERGKIVSKSGNDFLKIDFTIEHPNGERENIPSIWLHFWKSLEGKKSFIVSMSEGSGLKELHELKAK